MRRFRMTAAAIAVTLGLAGCFALPSTPLQRPPTSGSDSDGPQDWASLPHCDNGPPDPWVLVDDFPADLLESAGIQGECGDTYFADDLPPYVSIADSSVSLAELDALASALEGAGYERTEDSFEPVDDSTVPGGVGGWEYMLAGDGVDGHTLVYVINFWSGDDPDEYFTYVDVESPATRDLRP